MTLKAAQIRSLDGDNVQEVLVINCKLSKKSASQKRRKFDDLEEDAVNDSDDIEGRAVEGNEQGSTVKTLFTITERHQR